MLQPFRQIPIALAVVLAPAFAWADPPKTPGSLLGKWIVISVHVNGERQEYLDWEVNDEILFEAHQVIGLFSGDKAAVSKIESYPDKSLPQFRRFVYGEGNDKKLYIIATGIYSIRDDVLDWCEACPDKPVPTEFKTRKGDQRTLIVFRRKKENEKEGR